MRDVQASQASQLGEIRGELAGELVALEVEAA